MQSYFIKFKQKLFLYLNHFYKNNVEVKMRKFIVCNSKNYSGLLKTYINVSTETEVKLSMTNTY